MKVHVLVDQQGDILAVARAEPRPGQPAVVLAPVDRRHTVHEWLEVPDEVDALPPEEIIERVRRSLPALRKVPRRGRPARE